MYHHVQIWQGMKILDYLQNSTIFKKKPKIVFICKLLNVVRLHKNIQAFWKYRAL